MQHNAHKVYMCSLGHTKGWSCRLGNMWSYKNLSFPRGLAVAGNLMVVVEQDTDSVSIFETTRGKKIASIEGNTSSRGEQQRLKYPVGAAFVSQDRVVIADQGNHRVQVFSTKGSCIATVGGLTEGSKPLEFSAPQCVAVHHNGKVFITEQGNHRVQVLNKDLTFSHCFGREGHRPGEFSWPYGIAIDSRGMVYVADQYNHCVQKFSPEGRLNAVIDNKGESFGKLEYPKGLCIDGEDTLYVVEFTHNRICKFDTSGKFLGYVDDSHVTGFKEYRDITVTHSGKLFLTHNWDDVVTI